MSSTQAVFRKFLREQIRLAMLFGEKPFDVDVAHFGQRRGVPARLLILVDEPRAHAFGKKLGILMSLPLGRPALYVDSDVLFFPGASSELGFRILNDIHPLL